MELFFEKWRSYCIENPTIDDEIVGSIRKLETEDWFVFIASQIEIMLKPNEKNYSSKQRKLQKVLDLKIIVWKFSNKMAGK